MDQFATDGHNKVRCQRCGMCAIPAWHAALHKCRYVTVPVRVYIGAMGSPRALEVETPVCNAHLLRMNGLWYSTYTQEGRLVVTTASDVVNRLFSVPLLQGLDSGVYEDEPLGAPRESDIHRSDVVSDRADDTVRERQTISYPLRYVGGW